MCVIINNYNAAISTLNKIIPSETMLFETSKRYKKELEEYTRSEIYAVARKVTRHRELGYELLLKKYQA